MGVIKRLSQGLRVGPVFLSCLKKTNIPSHFYDLRESRPHTQSFSVRDEEGGVEEPHAAAGSYGDVGHYGGGGG